jgi:phosphotransferase system enzyme I (PtsI)
MGGGAERSGADKDANEVREAAKAAIPERVRRKTGGTDVRLEASGATVLRGIGVSPGVAIGQAVLVDRRRLKTPRYHIGPEAVEAEVHRFERARSAADEELSRILGHLEIDGHEHVILQAHQLMLRDELLVGDVPTHIRRERLCAEWAVGKTVAGLKERFDAFEDQYFRERRSDLTYVADRLLHHLSTRVQGVSGPIRKDEDPIYDNLELPEDSIVVAHDLSPAETALMRKRPVRAFVTDVGSPTSHTAIMARALEIPAVVALEDATSRIPPSARLIVDGVSGRVIVHPDAATLEAYSVRATRFAEQLRELDQLCEQPAVTTDGQRLAITGNVEIDEELDSLLAHGGEGIGLYRTEYLFLNRLSLPTEEDHYEHARRVLERLAPRPATFRTFDLGGDKFHSTLSLARELNPALGMRGIRLCLHRPELFRPQLRGLLRASAHGKLAIMFPMVSSLSELREARGMVEQAKDDLRREGHAFDNAVEVGTMIELPSAAICADLFAKECDFLSIGTNDLIQYALAIDRVNEHVAALYRPLDPAILRLLRMIAAAAKQAKVTLSMCGEMAGDPRFTVLLIGLGLEELSMHPTSIPLVKQVVRRVSGARARELLGQVLELSTAQEVERAVDEANHTLLGELAGTLDSLAAL